MEMQHFEDIYQRYRSRAEFSPKRGKFEKRVRSAYPILEDLAREREVITYGELASQIQTDRRRYLSFILDAISRMEAKEGNPPLSALVVQSGSRIPSDGFFTLIRDLGIDQKYESSNDKELYKVIKMDVYDFWASELDQKPE